MATSISTGLLEGYTDVQSRLYVIAHRIHTTFECQEIIDTYPNLQITVREAVERKLRKLRKGELPLIPPPASAETLWAIYDSNGKRLTMLCSTAQEAIDDLMSGFHPNTTWKDLVAKGYRVRKAHVTVEAAR